VGDVEEDMDVVGHDDEIAEVVEGGVVVAHGGFKGVAAVGEAEGACAEGGVEEALDGDGPEVSELGGLLGGVGRGIFVEPVVAGGAERCDAGGGEGIGEAEGDEVEGVGLAEMGEAVAMLHVGELPIEMGDGSGHDARRLLGRCGIGKGKWCRRPRRRAMGDDGACFLRRRGRERDRVGLLPATADEGVGTTIWHHWGRAVRQ